LLSQLPVILKESKPWTYWWWMGNAVDKENISYNLKIYSEAGFGGVHIIPIYGVKGYEDKFIDFLSPKWMEMLEFTANECKHLGMGLDISIGTGWPFGGPNVSIKNSSTKLIALTFDLKRNSSLSINILEEAKEKSSVGANLSILSVNSYSKDGRSEITNKVDNYGNLNWVANDDSSKIIALVLASPIQQVKRASPGGKGNVVDPFSVPAINDYLIDFDKAFEKYDPKLIRSFYHDSYEYQDADWSPVLLNEFRIRRGYNLIDYLPQFFGDGDCEITSRIKSDYRWTIAELHRDFIRRAKNWSNERGSLFRNQAHGSPTNILDVYAEADIPECEVFGAPKLDIKGLVKDSNFKREEYVDPIVLKFSSSAAHVTGKNLVASETGTWIAEHFRESLSQVKPEIDLLFLAGINHVMYHGIAYSPKGEEWPGWLFYASTNFGPSNSIWRDIPALNNYVARTQSILQEGKPDNDLLLYFPIWDLWHSDKDGLIPLRIHNPEEWLFNTNFYKTAQQILNKGYSADYISDDQIEKSDILNGDILSGGNKYKAIVIPSCRFIPVKTLEKLNVFIENGGKVIFLRSIPNLIPGFANYKSRQLELDSIMSIININRENYKNALFVSNDLDLQLEKSGAIKEYLVECNVNYIRRSVEDGKYYFLANQSTKDVNEWVKINTDAESIVIIDPLTNKFGLGRTKKNRDGTVSLFLQLDSGSSLILKTKNQKIKLDSWLYTKASETPIEIKGKWNVDFIDGAPTLPKSISTNSLKSWTLFGDEELNRFAGTAKYSIKFKNPDTSIKNWVLDLGKVCASARIKINNHNLGTLWSFPFKIQFGDFLLKGENLLEIEVTNLSANRIIDLDKRKVNWKKFYDINFVNINYKKFDSSEWELVDSGLLGPVNLYPAVPITDEYSFFDSNTDSLQIKYLLNRLKNQFDKRRIEFDNSLASPQILLERQSKLKKWYKNIIGELPRKTPFNIIITRKEEYEDYSIEWVAFESQPNHHVTGLFYLPKNLKPPYPSVYIPCGHSFNGKGSETYQKAARLFAQNGFAVLQADPISQGERFQYLDENGKTITEEKMLLHEILGEQLMLTGSNTLIHQLWDNIRCIDFLEAHPLIDKNRIGAAGNSGGGTQVTYLTAFDSRIKVAVPSCYIATTEKKFNTIGSQDGCQQIWGEGKIGAEEQDFLFMAAPIPIAILSAKDDFFNIDGAKTAVGELRKIYSVLGVPEKITHIVADGKHGWQKSLREASVQWFKKWFLNDDSPVVESNNIGYFENEKDYTVTKTGQVLTSFPNELAISDIIRKRVAESEIRRKDFLENHPRKEIEDKIKELIGFEAPSKNTKYNKLGRIADTEYEIEKYFLQRDSICRFSLPALLISPINKSNKFNVSIVVGNNDNKELFEQNKFIKTELDNGNSVLILDISNTGELKGNQKEKYDNEEYWLGKLPLYEGKTLLTYRTEDIIIGKNFIEKIFGNSVNRINIIASDRTKLASIHASFIDGNIGNLIITEPFQDFEEIAKANYSPDKIGDIIPNVLNYYEISELIKKMPNTKVTIINKLEE